MDSTFAPPVTYGQLALIHSTNGVKGDAEVFGREMFITGIYEWGWALGVFKVNQNPDSEPRLLGFLDDDGNLKGGSRLHTSEGISMIGWTKRRRKNTDRIIKVAVKAATPRWEKYKASGGVPYEGEFEVVENVHIFR